MILESELRRAEVILERLADMQVEWAIRTLAEDPAACERPDVIAFARTKADQYINGLVHQVTRQIHQSDPPAAR